MVSGRTTVVTVFLAPTGRVSGKWFSRCLVRAAAAVFGPGNQEHFQSDTPRNEEGLNPLQEVISHYQVMYDTIQQLDTKLDIIDKKVSKIQRSRVKYGWYYHKPLGHHYKGQNSSVSKKKSQENEDDEAFRFIFPL